MSRFYPLHVCSMLVQVLVFWISLVVGVLMLSRANFLTTAEAVVKAIREDDNLGPESQFKRPYGPEEDVVSRVALGMTVVGAICLTIAAVLAWNILCLLALMCGPNSSFVRQCLCVETLRDSLEDEIVAFKEHRDPNRVEYHSSRVGRAKLSERTKKRLTKRRTGGFGVHPASVTEASRRSAGVKGSQDLLVKATSSSSSSPVLEKSKGDRKKASEGRVLAKDTFSSSSSHVKGKERSKSGEPLTGIALKATSSSSISSPSDVKDLRGAQSEAKNGNLLVIKPPSSSSSAMSSSNVEKLKANGKLTSVSSSSAMKELHSMDPQTFGSSSSLSSWPAKD